MNWNLFAKTFVVIFLAEFADKTQLAAMSLAASEPERWTVFAAAAIALVACTAVGVLVGGAVGHFFEGLWVKRAVGLLFIVIGVLYLIGRA